MTMEQNVLKLTEILSKLKERYRQADNLMVMTKDMEKAVSMNDLESLEIVLNMRQKTMEQIDQLNREITETAEGLSKPVKKRVKQLLRQVGDPKRLDDPLETEIFEMNQSTARLIQKVIDLDEAVNKRFQREGAEARKEESQPGQPGGKFEAKG